jgi:phosphatidylinositol alpha-1,6-mannosyltransferase
MMTTRGTAQRVLFLLTEVFANGGIQRFNQTILDACGRLGIDCRVLSLNDSAVSIEKHPKRSHLSVAGFSGDRRRFALATAGTLLRDHYDRVLIGHINLLTLAIAVLALRPYHRTPTMLIAHGIEVWSGIGRVRRYALSRTDRILCVSHYTRQRILEQAPALLAERLAIFPNALADTWGRATPVSFTSTLPARFILSVTRLERGDRYKGIATVIEAFSMLADDSMQYLVIGHGNDLPFLQLVAERCGVKDRVHFMRGVSDSELIALYQKCEAFVLPSGKEGFGIVFLEAMFFGAPVIAAREKGAMDVVRDGDTGISVRFGDAIAIKEAIERIGSDTALREHLRANGRSLVVDGGPFTFARFTQRCAEVFELGKTIAA